MNLPKKKGWEPKFSESKVAEVPKGDESHYSVVIPISAETRTTEIQPETFLTWVSSEESEAEIIGVNESEDVIDSYHALENTDGRVSTATDGTEVDEGVMKTTGELGQKELESSDAELTASGDCPSSTCKQEVHKCDSYNWSCVALTAGAYVGVYGSCGACKVDLTRYTCSVCLGMLLTASGVTIGCDIGDNCGMEKQCRASHIGECV